MNQHITTSERPVIETDNLNFSFGKRQVLSSLGLKVPEACIFGFLGPNGAGKTTTIKCLLGLYQVPDNTIKIFNKDLNSNRLDILARTGNMVEEPSLYGHLSAVNNLKILAKLHQCQEEKIPHLLDKVGLAKDAKRPVRQFSSGMKQRLCIAMALLPNPELLILDEPINGMDPGGIIEIRTLLNDLCENQGVTVFISSHILSEIEKLCSHVAVIHHGNLLYQGRMQELIDKSLGCFEVTIETDDNEKARTLLQGSYPTEITSFGLKVNAGTREAVARIVEELVTSHIAVYQVKFEYNDLESAFLELIRQ